MIRRPPRSTRTDTLFPYTTLFRSAVQEAHGRPRRLRPWCWAGDSGPAGRAAVPAARLLRGNLRGLDPARLRCPAAVAAEHHQRRLVRAVERTVPALPDGADPGGGAGDGQGVV